MASEYVVSVRHNRCRKTMVAVNMLQKSFSYDRCSKRVAKRYEVTIFGK